MKDSLDLAHQLRQIVLAEVLHDVTELSDFELVNEAYQMVASYMSGVVP